MSLFTKIIGNLTAANVTKNAPFNINNFNNRKFTENKYLNAITDAVEDSVVQSNPPKGKCRVTNIYVNPNTGKITIEYDDTLL